MTPPRADRLQRLFKAALRHRPEDRPGFLEAACADDPALRRDVESLLEAYDQAELEGFMETPAADLAILAEDEEDTLEGRRVGAYTVQRLLGRGGMGSVYLALRDAPFRQYVALKVIRRGMDTADILRRFEMERQILASLNHPNIARLMDGGTTEDGLAFFVMERVEGVPVTEYCDTRRLSIDERLKLFADICRAVHYAHQNLVVHRDLKPSNIMVIPAAAGTNPRGQVKLLDFGVAKLLNPNFSGVEVPVTRTEFRVMTPEYASPEQVRGEVLTTASDLYALGVLLYELLTGHRPYRFTRRTVQEIERLVCEQDPERPSTKVGRVETITHRDGSTETITPASVGDARAVSPERLRRRLRGDLDNIVLMALRKEAARRYASAEQMAADIERFLAGRPVEARPNTVGYRARKFVRRNRVVVAAACVVALSLVGGLGAALWQAEQARRDRDRVAHELAKSEAATDFLTGLFAAVDPTEALGPRPALAEEVTARELLEQGVGRVETLQGQPELQAHLLRVVGRVYYNLGRYDRALPLLERALATRRDLYGAAHLDVAESLNDLAVLLRRMGRYEDALSRLREALALQRRLVGDEHPDVARTLDNLGWVLNAGGDYAAAEPYLRDAVAMRRKLLGDDHPDALQSLSNLGVVLHQEGDYAAAEPLLRQAVSRRRKILGPEHLDVANSLNKLALLLRDKGAYDEAETLFREALAMQRKILGDAYPEVAQSINDLAALLQDKGDYAAAESLFYEALALRRSLLGDEHPDVATSLHELALLLRDRGDYAAAESLLREALALRRSLLGNEHPDVAASADNLADLLRHTGDHVAAAPLFREALALRQKLLGDDHPDVARSLVSLASLHVDRGNYAVAEPLYLKALAVFRQALGDDHPSTREARRRLVDLYTAWGKPDDAARYAG